MGLGRAKESTVRNPPGGGGEPCRTSSELSVSQYHEEEEASEAILRDWAENRIQARGRVASH